MDSETFYGVDVPKPLQELSRRHQQHIAQLVSQFRDVGMDERSIENAVDRPIESYRDQLLEAVKSLGLSHG